MSCNEIGSNPWDEKRLLWVVGNYQEVSTRKSGTIGAKYILEPGTRICTGVLLEIQKRLAANVGLDRYNCLVITFWSILEE
jgi:hypothetical protein